MMHTWTRKERLSFEWHTWFRSGGRKGFRGQVSANRYRWPLGFDLSIGGEYGEVGLTLTCWRLFVHIAVCGVVPSFVKHYNYRTDEIEVVRLSVGQALRWSVWLDAMQSSLPGSYNRPPKWRYGYVNLVDLILGRRKYEAHEVKPRQSVVVPLPEGPYEAEAKFEQATWKRPRWPRATVRESVWLEIPKGLPHAGKGENSWDCDDDGIFGIGSESLSVPKAIAHAVEATLERRERYGMPASLRRVEG